MVFTEVNLYQLAIENIARVKEVQNALDEDGGRPRERPTLKRGTERKGRQVVDCGRDLWDRHGIYEHLIYC